MYIAWPSRSPWPSLNFKDRTLTYYKCSEKFLSFFWIISATEIKYINTKGSQKLIFPDIITVILIRKWAFRVLGYIRSMTKWKLIEIRLHPPTCFCRLLSSKGTTELTMLHESSFIHLKLFCGWIKLALTCGDEGLMLRSGDIPPTNNRKQITPLCWAEKITHDCI